MDTRVEGQGAAALSASHLSFRYGPVQAVKDVTFSVPEGETLAVLGPNGAGKSTLLSLLLGLLSPGEGNAQIFGRPAAEAVADGWVGAMLQERNLPSLVTGKNLLQYMGRLYPRALKWDEAADLAGITEFVNRSVDRLSGGQRRRIQFAIALASRAPVIFLDEPTEGMDVEARANLWTQFKSARDGGIGRTLIFTTHDLTEADRYADRILIMAQGEKVALDTPLSLKRSMTGSRVRFEGPPDLDLLSFSGQLGVEVVLLGGTRYEAIGEDSDRILRDLMNLGPRFSAFDVAKSSLEDVFRSLVAAGEMKEADKK